ncbi:TIGR04076 family protein [Streptosporangium sp. NPDC051022]|uniref:TIGR04076 family protein n=1 Tax=Streptosporangium sp. NPDC051022 TaxID=3155752 RepID=UPI003431684B
MRCTVTSMNYSACELRVGDYFEVGPRGVSLPPGRHFCFYAIAAVAPMINGRLDGPDAEAWLASRPLVACPDPPENLIMCLEEVHDDV